MDFNDNKYTQSEFLVEMEKSFKFNSAHFVVYGGFREPLHGHNYKVSIKICSKSLNSCNYVVDFGIIKESAEEICKNLKHCLLLPKFNNFIVIKESENKS